MGLNDLEIGYGILKDLYEKVLIVEKKPFQVTNSTGEIKYIGKNFQNISFVWREENLNAVPDAIDNFLGPFLNKVGLSFDDVSLINLFENTNLQSEKIVQVLSPRIILFFGVEPDEIGFPLKFPINRPQNFGEMVLFRTCTVAEAQHKDAKKAFWEGIKSYFQQ